MQVRIKPIIWLIAIVMCGGGSAWAGGFELGDQGARATGRGGAFVVKADDGSAIYYNPAGLAKIDGTHLYLSYRMAYGDVEYRRARTLDWSEAVHGLPRLVQFDHVKSETPFFPMGLMFAAVTDFGLDDWGFGIGAYGPPGIGTSKYQENGPQKYMLEEMDVVVLYYTLSAAWKYKDIFGIGASVQYVHMPTFGMEMVIDGNINARTVHPESSRFDIRSKINGEDIFNMTAILGLWYKPLPYLEIAAAARLVPIEFNVDGHIGLEALELNLTEPISSYRKDGAGGTVDDDSVVFSMVFPPKVRWGIRYIHEKMGREVFDIELDFSYEFWSMVDSYTLDGRGLYTAVIGRELEIG